jgi:hypothetical protein
MENLQEPIQLKASDLSTLREKLIQEQNGICPICERALKNPVVDHQHTRKVRGTGLVRAVICSTCNTFLARSENNAPRHCISLEELPTILRNMANYLEAEHLPYIHPTEKPKEPAVSKRNFNILLKKLKQDCSFKKKYPEYPKSSKLTKELKVLFEKYEVPPFN